MHGLLKRFGHGLLLVPLLLLAPTGCKEYLDFTPFAADPENGQRTARQLQAVRESSRSDFVPFTFSALADIQISYQDLHAAVGTINRRGNSEFVVVAGDLTDFGLLQEFVWTEDLLSRLQVPYLAVTGNHDALNNGKLIYRELYGPFDYTLVFNNVKFIFLNSNSWEFENQAPDLDWLEQELTDAAAYQHVILVAHILPLDPRFQDGIGDRYLELLRQHHVTLLVGGHDHIPSVQQIPLPTGLPMTYLINGSVGERSYHEVTVTADAVAVYRVEF